MDGVWGVWVGMENQSPTHLNIQSFIQKKNVRPFDGYSLEGLNVLDPVDSFIPPAPQCSSPMYINLVFFFTWLQIDDCIIVVLFCMHGGLFWCVTLLVCGWVDMWISAVRVNVEWRVLQRWKGKNETTTWNRSSPIGIWHFCHNYVSREPCTRTNFYLSLWNCWISNRFVFCFFTDLNICHVASHHENQHGNKLLVWSCFMLKEFSVKHWVN